MPDAPYRFTHMHWRTNTSVMAPLPSGMPLSLSSLPGAVKCLQSDLLSASIWEAALRSELSGMAFKIFHSSAHITLVIQIKAEGDDLCLEFPEFHYQPPGLSQGQALWLLHSHALISRR